MSDDIAIRLRCHDTEGVTSSDRYHLRNEAAAEIDRLRAALASRPEVGTLERVARITLRNPDAVKRCRIEINGQLEVLEAGEKMDIALAEKDREKA